MAFNMKIEWHTEKRKLGDLKVLENNPRKISDKDFKKLGEDIEEMGNFRPLIVDTENVILGGNQRYRQLLDKYGQDFEVEVSLPNRELSENERKKIIITDNTHRGDWDLDILGNEFDDILEDLEIDDLLPEVGFEVKEDDYEEPEDLETAVVLGDVYQLGQHKLMCGDSTKIEDIEKLMNGEKADMVFTDPPYGMNLDTDYSGITGSSKAIVKNKPGKVYGKVYGDTEEYDPTFLLSTFRNTKEIFMWGGDYYSNYLPRGGYFVWDKCVTKDGVVSEGAEKMIGSTFELCWSKQKHKREIARIFSRGFTSADKSARVHPTQKPIQLAVWFYKKFSKEKDLIVDLYGGSGSFLMACEQTNRKCYMMEIDPYYCQVIIDRWEKFTGKKAKKL